MNAVITGTSRGIGLELCHQGLERCERLLAVARHPERSAGLAELKKKFSERLTILELDLAHPDAPARIASAVGMWPSLDLLINNAGVLHEADGPDDFMASFQINSVAPFFVTSALLPALKKSRQPKVAHISSRMGSIADNASGGHYSYRASKAALNMINKCLSVDHDWLTCVVLHPGWVQTDMGGTRATTPASESAAGLWRVIQGLRSEDSGHFFDFRGQEIPF